MKRRLLLVLALLPCLAPVVCFPDLPDPGLVDNLRILAVQADPATAVMDSWPLPTVTVTALVVDPADEDLAGATHRWWLDLDESIEGVDMLLAMIPPEPHGPSIVIDPNLMLAAAADDDDDDASGPLLFVLPLRYRVETADDFREAVKLVYFLTPEATGDDDDSATGDDDDSAAGDDDDSAATGDDDDSAAGDDDDSAASDDDDTVGDDDDTIGDDDDSAGRPPAPASRADDDDEVENPEGYNANPTLLSLTIDDDRTYTAGAGDLPGIDGVLALGTIDRDTGVKLTIEVDDDKDPLDVGADLFWTGGCPGLPVETPGQPGAGATTDPDVCPSGASTWGYGGSATLDDGDPAREFGWYPLSDTGPTRLWLILSDGEGGTTWIELTAP